MSKLQSKQKLVVAAADLLRRRGLQATSVRELAKHADAPLGSVYHYFPGGKGEFVADAVTFTACQVLKQLAECLALGPVDGFKRYFAQWRSVLVGTAYSAGCPLAAIAMDAQAQQDAPEALTRVSTAFKELSKQIASSLLGAGISLPQAEHIATTIVALTEGAILICRANQDLQALYVAETIILDLINNALIPTSDQTE